MEVRNTSEKSKKILAKSEKILIKVRCCEIPGGQTDEGSSQKHFLPFRVLLNVGINPNFPVRAPAKEAIALQRTAQSFAIYGQSKVYELIT